MHLEGPWLTTTGKRKGKQKWRSAEHKRQAEQLDQEWKAILKKHELEKEERKRRRALTAEVFKPINRPFVRDTPKIPSLNGGVDSAPALKNPQKVYTGDKIIGIGTMHKSNAVPIFSDTQAKEISSMRR